MKTLIDLGISTLCLAETNYELLGVAGQGGSSIVYKAKKEGKAEDYYMLKEFYPHDLAEGRNEDGSICYLDNMREVVEKRKLRALKESEIVDMLRHDEENNDPWFLYYSEPIHANNTLYTIIATESGAMLSEKLSSGYFKNKDFADICEHILLILDALEPIHNKGYLHLDVSPDNIHFSDLGIMRMIDYNSAFHVTGSMDEFLPSYKEGYSAPELKKSHEPPGTTADLFSVAAIFFEMLIGRPPESGDWAIPSRWQLTTDEGILKGASELLIKSTNSFLKNNLARTPRIRSQSIAQMRDKINLLFKLSEAVTLINSPKRPNPNFVCRELEIEAIGQFFNNDSYVILEGMGGIGKTELAKKYVWDNRDKYNAVQFLSYNENLMTTVAVSLKLNNFGSDREAEYEASYGNEALKYLYRDKVNHLKKSNDSLPCLVVIDNYNVQADDDFAEFVSGEYKVIFTSRNRHDDNTIEITEMKDESQLLELFGRYYTPLKLADESKPIVLDIIRLVLGHTMTVMLIAAAMKKSRKKPQEMFELLQKGLDPKLRTKISLDKEDISAEVREQVMYSHITTLFDMTQILSDQNYSFIMTNMAIVPHTGMDIETFYDWALVEWYKHDDYDDKDYSDIEKLIELRWIQSDEERRHISLHPVVSDVAYRELEPDSVKCEKLIKRFVEYASKYINEAHFAQSDCIDMLELVCLRIMDESKLTANLFLVYSKLANVLAKYSLAMKYAEKASKISKKVFGENHLYTGEVFHEIASIFENQGIYSTALKCYEKSLSVFEKVLGKNHSNTAAVINEMGMIYSYQGDYANALEWCHKALDIKKKLYGEDHPTTASAYVNIGFICNCKGDYNEALEWHFKASVIFEKVYGKEHLDTATAYNNIGYDYSRQDNFSESLKWYKKSLEIREMLLGAEHPSTATIYNNIAVIYEKQGDYSKALEWHHKTLNIQEKVFGKYHPHNSNSYNNIAIVYARQKNYGIALEWFQKALAIDEAVFGKDHPETANTYNSIAFVCISQGEYEKALEWCQRALPIQEAVFGKKHSYTSKTYNRISEIYDKLGEHDKANEYKCKVSYL